MRFIAVLLWLVFLALLGGICYLQFQPQVGAKAIDQKITNKIAEYLFNLSSHTDEESVYLVWKTRQIVRILLFGVLGIVGTSMIHITFYRLKWITRTLISSVMLLLIAVLTEKFKDYLQTRHFSEEEMWFSIIGVLTGFCFVSIVTMAYSFTKWILGKIKVTS